jgi:hypothetical protein
MCRTWWRWMAVEREKSNVICVVDVDVEGEG